MFSNKLNTNLAIGWIDLNYDWKKYLWSKPNRILNSLCGCIEFGTLTALMGPSGAGKSTLLKCINGRNRRGIDEFSQIYACGEAIRTCFIVQNVSEHLLAGLTATQSLIYASKLKNSGAVDHKENARNLLDELMISNIENTSVERCSGGEQKRLAIALELTSIDKPNIICIDEPTSGLDSNAADVVIQSLKTISKLHNIAIITSIHQPNNDLVMLFDNLYILAKGGVCIYSGPPKYLEYHLNKAEIYCNEYEVPVEMAIKISSGDELKCKRLERITFNSRNELLLRCSTGGQLTKSVTGSNTTRINLADLWYLLMRSFTQIFRSQWKANIIQFLFYLVLILVMTKLYNSKIGEPNGCIESNQTRISVDSEYLSLLTQNNNFQLMNVLALQFLMTVGTVLVFSNEVKVFLNEHRNGWYSTGSFYWSKTIVELPLCLLITMIYTLIAFKLSNQIGTDYRFLKYLGVMTLSMFSAQGLGLMIGILAESNDKLAIILSVGFNIYNVLFCGFFSPISELPRSIRWISNLSYLKTTYEMLMYILYGFDRCPVGHNSVLINLKLNENDFFKNLYILSSEVIIFRIISLIILLIKSNFFH